MIYSIYHFFKSLVEKKQYFSIAEKLESFPFDDSMLSCKNAGQFPDLAIKLTINNSLFSGGELIELKDSQSYTVSSFNSTIPTGKKDIEKVIKSVNSSIKKQMEEAGNHIYSLQYRDIFYLIRGQHKNNTKIVLTHGSFFETIKSNELISQSFEQVLDESILKYNIQIDNDTKSVLVDMFSEQDSFSKVRNVDNASVKLRFRIMTEVKAEGNILNSNQYPEIKDNTLNLIAPYNTEEEKETILKRFKNVFNEKYIKDFSILPLKHHLDGYFLVFQTAL
ncbi:MAG: hypothetical protein LBG72_09045 [Spirochaetaceae bacterium]|nr:hypothetical protein [Spirochaetaceae bacterium]